MQDSEIKEYIKVLKNSEDLIKNFKEELEKNNIKYTDELWNSFCEETAEKEFKKVDQDCNKTVSFKE